VEKSSAAAALAATSSGTGSPRCSRRTFSIAAARPACAASRSPSGRPAIAPSRPAFSFSQIRGTAKKKCGRTCGITLMIVLGSGTVVIVAPKTMGR
jgi:hypothetical protein